jgi:hypothetical protein
MPYYMPAGPAISEKPEISTGEGARSYYDGTMKAFRRALRSGALVRFLTVILPAIAVLSGLTGEVSGAASIEGKWVLTEQRYGSGHGNLAPPDPPLRLEFVVSQGRLSGRIWSEASASKALPWPSFPSEQGPRPIEVRELRASPGGDQARAVYRVRVGEREDQLVEIVENYRLSDDGRGLIGIVTVTAVDGKGASQGSYTLHRRFERMR